MKAPDYLFDRCILCDSTNTHSVYRGSGMLFHNFNPASKCRRVLKVCRNCVLQWEKACKANGGHAPRFWGENIKLSSLYSDLLTRITE